MASGPTSKTAEIENEFPLHVLVWRNDYETLKTKLIKGIHVDELEKKDVRGRSPLMLAVTLGHLEVSKILMEYGANVNTENKDGWTVAQEAVSTGDPELLCSVLEWRDYQRYSSRVGGVPELLLKLKEAPDFYVEMKWEFTSWVPLVSRMCPSDTYKVYKQGSKVRIDTTLLGFDQNKWHRGNTSFIFHGQDNQATIMEVDHENAQVFVEQMKMITTSDLQILQPSQQSVSARLTTPITTTYLDTDKISFERNRSGIWGWRQDKTELVSGHPCKVFGASNVQLVTKTRTEHLSEDEKQKFRSSKTPLQSFLGIAETEERSSTQLEEFTQFGNPCHITLEEYFDGNVELGNRDIGRPKDISTKIQKFKATLWLSEDYPLSLPEQIMPIVDLMAISSSHFAKLKNLYKCNYLPDSQLKLDPVQGVSTANENGKTTCIVQDSCFIPPSHYSKLGPESRRHVNLEEEDDMLQYAIQQSLLQSGHDEDQVDIWEALQVQRPNTPNCFDDEERQLQRAIQASLTGDSTPGEDASEDEPIADLDLLKAIQLSEKQREEEENQRRREQEMFEGSD